jgi:ribosomal protein S18 acetylase RimI-like enzyme
MLMVFTAGRKLRMPDQSLTASIELATPADFLPISALDRIAWLHTGEPFIADGEHVWRVWCQYATVIVARVQSELPQTGPIAGALLMFPTNGNEQFLHKIMVHPDCRGRGLGSQLMQAGLARANQPVLLTVDPQNSAAVQLYRNFGFEVREHVAGYYRQHEHRYLMAHYPDHHEARHSSSR